MKVVSKFTPEWFTPAADESARFRVRPLNGAEFNDVAPDVEIKDGKMVLRGDAVRSALAAGLMDWEGVEAEDGPLDCTTANHKFLPFNIRLEIASKIIEKSLLTEEESKNSGSQSKPTSPESSASPAS